MKKKAREEQGRKAVGVMRCKNFLPRAHQSVKFYSNTKHGSVSIKKRRVLCKKKEGEVDGWRKTLKLYVLLIFLNKLSFILQLLVMAGIDATV